MCPFAEVADVDSMSLCPFKSTEPRFTVSPLSAPTAHSAIPRQSQSAVSRTESKRMESQTIGREAGIWIATSPETWTAELAPGRPSVTTLPMKFVHAQLPGFVMSSFTEPVQ